VNASRRLLVSAGEISGDRLAAAYVQHLRTREPRFELAGCGGERLHAAGATLFLRQERIDFVGWAGPLRHLPRLWTDRRRFLRWMGEWNPDSLLLVDSPGWNRPLVEWGRRCALPVRWIAPPQLWAWQDRKAPYLEGITVHPLFAFETPWLERWGARVQWLGFPREPAGLTRNDEVLALLPGTREVLWKRHLPLFAQVAQLMGMQARVAVPESASQEFEDGCRSLGLATEPASTLLARAGGCVAVPGTGCLEAVRHGIPLVAGANPGWLDATLAKRLLSQGSRLLPNRILARTLVEEYYLEAAHPETLAASLETAMSRRREFVEAREELEGRLGPARFG
jgi:lipid-A-disaccharide synthase